MDVTVLSKFFEDSLKILLVPEIPASPQPRDRVRFQINITAIILRLCTPNLHALEEGKGEGEYWDTS